MSSGFRHEQLSATILRAVQLIGAKGLSDPRLDGALLTFTGIDLSPDSRNATIKVSVLPEKAQNRAIAALKHAQGHFKHALGDALNLRTTPVITFSLDISLKKQAHLYNALGKIAEEKAASDAAHATDPAQPDPQEPTP